MDLRALIAAEKTDIKIGLWRAGKLPRADFPLAKNALRFGSSFEWCIVTFVAMSAECRVLVLFNPGKEKYDAILGVMAGAMLRVLCAYQYHATEPGWHAHATCDSINRVPPGFSAGRGSAAFPPLNVNIDARNLL